MEEGKPLFGRFMLFLFVSQAMFIGGIVALMTANPPTSSSLISVGSPLIILITLHLAFRWLWNRMTSPFPPQEMHHTVEHRHFQSFSWGYVNMGLSIHAAVDDTYLHMEPLLLWRVRGANSASIPFSSMTPAERGRGVRINGMTMMGPKWCFQKLEKSK